MATATGVRPRLSRPRRAATIVEAAAFATAAILLAWLAFWLIRQQAQGLVVDARHLLGDGLGRVDAPFTAADARSILGPDRRADAAARTAGFVDDVKAAVAAPGGPVVYYISAPLLGHDRPIGDAKLADLIAQVAAAARRDVVLALDLAQVDSDRDLGVYAASPYHGLAEAVAKIEPGSHVVYVLTSAGPAQKSWASDALGGSVFAHFLRAGLAGDSAAWDEVPTPGRVSVEGLHQFVRHHVAGWARKHRGANQTPMLLRVGEPRRPVALAFARPSPAPAPPAEPPAPKDAPKPEEKPAAKDADPAKPAPPPADPPREALLRRVVEEWKAHDALAASSPWRSSPARFRAYQGLLLRAERLLRSSWNDPAALDDPRKGLADVEHELASAVAAREAVQAAVKAAEAHAESFPFKPARAEEAGRRDVTEALTFLTGAGPEDHELYAAPAPIPAAPAAADAKPAAPAPKAPEPPRALAEASTVDHPERFLELQLPAWALGYAEAFKVPDHFRAERRGAALRRLVESRAVAEDALGADLRGLDWVQPGVEKGDEARRRLQDDLFDPSLSSGEAGKALVEGASTLRRQYEPARRFGRAFHDGRVAWERVAARLPDLAEWAVRSRVATRRDGPFPGAAADALDAAATLADELHRPAAEGVGDEAHRRADAIGLASQKASAAVDALERSMLDSTRSDDWDALDAALRTPWIPAESRRRLLEAAVGISESLPIEKRRVAPDSAGDDAPDDPRFWALAVGLAELDRRLALIAAGSPAPDRSADPIAAAIEAVRARPIEVDAALRSFGEYGESARKRREDDRAARARVGQGEPRKPKDLQADFQKADRAARLMGRAEALADRAGGDARVAAWDRLARLRALDFHAARLREDYVRSAPRLLQEVAALAKDLNAVPPADRFAAWAPLGIRVEPSGETTVRIGEDGRAEIKLGLEIQEEREAGIPGGRAFVGLSAPPPELEVRGAKPGATASPPGMLKEVGRAPDAAHDAYVIRQLDAATKAEGYPLVATAFYRGRIDPRGAVPLAVVPRSFAEPVTIQIAHDAEYMKRRYGAEEAKLIMDQFRLHPGFGYMHRDKSAPYRLTFRNETFQDLKVHYKRTLVDPAGKPPVAIDEVPAELALAAGKSAEVLGEVKALQVPFGEVRALRLEWGIVGRPEPRPPFQVQFAQVGVEEYMVPTPGIKNVLVNGLPQDSYVVHFRRRADDKVREPILGEEVRGTINGREEGLKPSEVIRPGEGFQFFNGRTSAERKFTWSARIENDEFKPRESNP
ncbi:MAG: hypothetical protein BGO49_20455 [Planctomycetales bacterium 71-10]|nr:MAG: hypothetical protein BGO49_20455 [Planctomycetales bacterium 71-10]